MPFYHLENEVRGKRLGDGEESRAGGWRSGGRAVAVWWRRDDGRSRGWAGGWNSWSGRRNDRRIVFVIIILFLIVVLVVLIILLVIVIIAIAVGWLGGVGGLAKQLV